MTLPIEIRGKNGTGGVVAEVTERGQLIVAPISYSSPFVATLDAADKAFNLAPPKPEQHFIITDAIITGTKSIDPNTDATVVIYEGASESTITVDDTLIQLSVPRSSIIPLTGLNVITENPAKYVNIKTSDATVECTIMGYYIGHHHSI